MFVTNCLLTALYLIQYLYISYVLSFQAAEMKEKVQLATSESRELSIPVKQDKDSNASATPNATRRQLLIDQPLENTPNPGKIMLYFGTY